MCFLFFFYLQCPKCNICIEKNGGCNHMQCYHCKHDFCWMCLGDWKTHGSEYYECSRYKENPNIAHESVHAQAREALKKYLHYYERVSIFLDILYVHIYILLFLVFVSKTFLIFLLCSVFISKFKINFQINFIILACGNLIF